MPSSLRRRPRGHALFGLAAAALLVVGLGSSSLTPAAAGPGRAELGTADLGATRALAATTSANGTGDGFWHAVGSQLVDAHGTPVRSTGLNWFGMETSNNTFHGLWA